jgi:hypothetical protein
MCCVIFILDHDRNRDTVESFIDIINSNM